MDDDVVPQHTHLGVPGDLAVLHIAAGDGADGADLIGLAHLGVADDDFLELGRQHALHGVLDLVDGVVDHAVHAHIHLGAGSGCRGHGIGTDVEAHDDGVGGGGKEHVVLRNRADTGVNNLDADFLVGDLLQAGLDRLGGALDVGLDDDVEFLHLALLDLGEEILQGDLTLGLVGRGLDLLLALLHQLARHALVLHGVEDVAGAGHFGKAGDLHRHGGTSSLHGATLVVGHHADAAHGSAGDENIALLEGAVLHQKGGHGASGLIQPRFDDHALGQTVGIGLELLHLGGEDDHFQKLVDALACLGGDGADDGLAAPLLGHQVVLGELLLDAVGVGSVLIHLVDGHDDGDIGGLGVVDGLDGLGHDAVVGGHHEDGNVGAHGAAGTHGGEGRVAGGIQEGDGAAVDLHGVGADVLGDAAGLAGGHVGIADGVEKAGLAVVDVTHDHHHGASRLELFGLILPVVDEALFNGDDDFLLHLAPKLHGNQGGGIIVHGLVDAGHDAQLDELLDDLGSGLLHPGGQLAHGDLVGDLHHQRGFLGHLQLQAAHLLLLLVAALVAGKLVAAGLLILVADLLLAAGIVLHPLGHQCIHPVVKAVGIDGDGAGIDNPALSLALGLLGLLGLGLLGGLIRLGLLLGGRRLGRLLLRLGLFGLGRRRFLGRGGRCLGLGLLLGSQRLFQGRHLVALGQYVKEHIQLFLGENLLAALGFFKEFPHQRRDGLGGYAKILGHFSDAIFDKAQYSHLHTFLSRKGLRLRRLLAALSLPDVRRLRSLAAPDHFFPRRTLFRCAFSSLRRFSMRAVWVRNVSRMARCRSGSPKASTKASAKGASVRAARAQALSPRALPSSSLEKGTVKTGGFPVRAKDLARRKVWSPASSATIKSLAWLLRQAAPQGSSPTAMRPPRRASPR